MSRKKWSYFYIVRHGQTDWNILKKVQGQKDIPLNEVGESQAQSTRELLEDVRFDVVFSSDLCRARRTAEIIVGGTGVQISTTPELRERDYGEFNGAPSDKGYEVEREMSAWERDDRKGPRPYPDFESDEELRTRLMRFLSQKALQNLGKTMLVVTHAGPLRRILTHLGFVAEEQMPLIQNAAYIKVRTDGSELFIDELSGIAK